MCKLKHSHISTHTPSSHLPVMQHSLNRSVCVIVSKNLATEINTDTRVSDHLLPRSSVFSDLKHSFSVRERPKRIEKVTYQEIPVYVSTGLTFAIF